MENKTGYEKLTRPISAIFLQEFARRIVVYGYAEEIRKAIMSRPVKPLPRETKEIKEEIKEPPKEIQKQPQKQIQRQPPPQQARRPMMIRRPMVPLPRIAPGNYVEGLISRYSGQQQRPIIINKQQQTNTVKNNIYETSLGTPIQIAGLEKVMPLLNDPYAQSIECPGPDKPLLINSVKGIGATSITLSAEQISRILQQISQMTRIPLDSGIFKTAFDKYLMTAVISEIAGTRFIIQKKTKPEDIAI